MRKHEEDYIYSRIDEDRVLQEAREVYEQRLRSERHYEYQAVIVSCGTYAGKKLLVETNGSHITNFVLR